jgi:hypothetical protein
MLRLVGLVFLVLGLLAFAWDLVSPPAQGLLGATGERWGEVDRESLLLLQAGVQRHVHAGLWDHALQPLMECPLAVTFWAVSGLCFVAASIHRR